MRTHKASQKQSSATNSLVSRPFVVQPKAEERKESLGTQGYKSQMPEFAIFNPAGEQSPVQMKLAIGAPGDKYEQEADRTAKLVVQRINTPAIARSTSEPSIQRRGGLEGGEASTDLESAINSSRSGGQPLDAGLQAKMSTAMGADFSGVRVHTDAQSDQLNRSIQAKAFTTGQDVFFRQGEYQPGSHGGQELIAHELTHVVQQNGGTVQRSPFPEESLQSDHLNVLSTPQSKDIRIRRLNNQPRTIVQMYRSQSDYRGDIISRIMNLIKADNFSLVLILLEEGVKNGSFDQEDLNDIYDKLCIKQDLRSIIWSWKGLSSSEDQGTREVDEFIYFDLPGKIVELRDKIPPLPEKAEEEQEEDDKYKELAKGPGKQRIQVPASDASRCKILSLKNIRWSQSDVKAATGDPQQASVSLTDIVKFMASGGWKGSPVEVIEIESNYLVKGVEMNLGMKPGYVSKDNRRLLCAYTAGLTTIPCDIKDFNDRVPGYIDDKLKKSLWYDKTNSCLRFGNQGEGFDRKGKPVDSQRWELILQKGYQPVNYGELIIVRTANQPDVKATGTSFIIGGSDLPPYMKI